jgi:hypothetical protein
MSGPLNLTHDTFFEGDVHSFVFCNEAVKVDTPAEFWGTILNTSGETVMVNGKPLANGKARHFKRWKTTRYKIGQLLAKML